MSEKQLYSLNRDALSLAEVIHILSQEHDNQTAIQLARDWCMQTKDLYIKKISMEFMYINGHYDQLEQLISENKNSDLVSNQKWAEIYQLMLERRQKRISPEMILSKLETFDTNGEPELMLLVEFLKVSVYYSLYKFHKVGNFLEKEKRLLDQVEDRFMASSFKVRTYQNLFFYHWTRNELIIARKYAFQVLNETIDMQVKASLHVNLGLTYTFDSFEQAMLHLQKALSISEKYGYTYITQLIERQNIPFICAHFNRPELFKTDDLSEHAHLEIKKGNLQKAVAILETISLDSPFKLYYMGMAKRDKQILIESYHQFVRKRGDYFFARLPLNAIKELSKSIPS